MPRALRIARILSVLVASSASAQEPNRVGLVDTRSVRAPSQKTATGPTIEQFLSPPSPLEFSAARKTDRLAWVTYEKGLRNVYTAAAPDFKAVRITKFMDDDGVDVSSVRLSDDGSVAIFVRGSGQNRQGWVANPSHNPSGPDPAVWAAKTDGSGAWRLASIENTESAQGGGFGGRGGGPELSPDGKHIAFIRRPGTPFGNQAQQGIGGVGNPAGPAAAGAAGAGVAGAAGRGGRQGGRAGGGGGGGGRGGRSGATNDTTPARVDG